MLQSTKRGIGNLTVKVIRQLARRAKIDLIRLAYSENGITKSYSMEASGETYFVTSFLPEKLGKTNPVLLDVGGNKGDYSHLLRTAFPKASIYTFEPNPNTFKALTERLGDKIEAINQGVGAESGTLNLYFDKNNTTSVQATSDPEILNVIAGTDNLVTESITVTTLDAFCQAKGIEHIDVLKIDTEGFELEALQGAQQLIANKAIGIIQFEFNEVNIVKRRFLRDFYLALPNYDFYRLDEQKLIPLNDWQPIHEIFMFQNIVAILR